MAIAAEPPWDGKRDKRARIYREIYERRITSRPEIAASLSLSLPTVAQYVQELQAMGLVEERGILDSTGGRKPVALSCIPAARVSVGLSLTPQGISGVAADLFGQILASEKQSAAFTQDASYQARLGSMVRRLLDRIHVADSQVLGVTVAVPGIVSSDGASIVYSHVFPIGLRCEALASGIHFPCSFCNDANAAGFTELWDSPPQRTAAYLSLNNTVGGAILMNRTIYAGVNGRGGEFGHISISRDGPRCRCGQRGCLGRYCAAAVLSDEYEGSLDAFFQALKAGDDHAAFLWRDYLDYLASGISVIRTILDCDVIVGGDVGAYMEPYMDTLRAMVKARDPFGGDASFIRPCRHPHMASSTGAALHTIQEFLAHI